MIERDETPQPPAWGVAVIFLLATTMITALEWWLSRSDLMLSALALNLALGLALNRLRPADYDSRWMRKMGGDL